MLVASQPFKTHPFLNIPIAAATMNQLLDRVHETILRRRRLQIGVVNAAKVVNMRRDLLLRQDVLSSDVILADGIAIVWASRLLGRKLPERIAGIDIMMEILKRGNRGSYSVYLLGATEEVSLAVAQRIARNYPGVRVAGRRNGYFSEGEENLIAAEIARSRPDILFIAMSSPKKERFLARWGKHMGVPVCHGVGGSFDVFAGKVQRAPAAWQKLGLEWLYRLKQEPRRLLKRYLVTNLWFCGMVLREMAGGQLRRNAAVTVSPRKDGT
jgi:N-acetylglucosaminyldiphosphoundecaprenol N-acetyl-beta-D-mannosaminyltransferase